MSNDKLKFWVKCPDCHKPFGVAPKAVVQYLNRLIEAHGFESAEPGRGPASPGGRAGNPGAKPQGERRNRT